ncbi:MAG TPA: Ig-like domain-containing protein, partial [Jiangellaceae bacterium]|nr:Ig-like domain-containing protein [Jiangellaceae bacterium]
SDLPASPRVIPVGAPVTETLQVELDQDWFAIDVATASGARITVTPPAFGGGTRAPEMDPVIELYGPGGGLIASADATSFGEAETIEANLTAGRHLVKVANYAASISPATYGLRADLGPAGPGPQPEGPGPWVANAAPVPHARSIATTARPSITFGRDLLGPSVTSDTVHLLDGRTAGDVEASLSRTGRTVALTPDRPLTPGVPYQLFVAGVRDATGEFAPVFTIPFVTAPAPPPTYPVNGTYSPFSGDLDANGFDDIVWYGPGTVPDSMWLFDGDGRVGVPISVGGTYVPAVGDLDGNGYDDIFWYRPGTASDGIWYFGPSDITARSATVNGTYTPVTGDFDRNGYDDILWYGRGTIPDTIWYFTASGLRGRAVTVNGFYNPMAGDFNRDGYGDVFWYVPGSGAEATWYGQPAGFRGASAPAVAGTYTTRVLDADGDGYDDVFWYSGTASSLWRSGPRGFTGMTGPALALGTRPITGELTGDGRDDVFAYVPGATADRLRPGTDNGIG